MRARKRFNDEDILNLLRQIELRLAFGSDVASVCRSAGYALPSFTGLHTAELRFIELPESQSPSGF